MYNCNLAIDMLSMNPTPTQERELVKIILKYFESFD